nr:MAG TPA: hypothetical protein [Caudoviricetes sp.]
MSVSRSEHFHHPQLHEEFLLNLSPLDMLKFLAPHYK